MAENLESLIRQWCHRGDGTSSAPAKPTEQCLSFAEAEGLAGSDAPPGAAVAKHIAHCKYCTALVADFREAIAAGDADVPAQPSSRRGVIWLRPAMALAASVVIAIGIGLWFTGRNAAGLELLSGVEVGLRERIDSGMSPEGQEQFATGQVIMFRVELRQACHVMLINLDPAGKITALPPRPSASAKLAIERASGCVKLGPYRLDDQTGLEFFFIVAFPKANKNFDTPEKISHQIQKLQAKYNSTGNIKAVAKLLQSWDANVELLSFQHTKPK